MGVYTQASVMFKFLPLLGIGVCFCAASGVLYHIASSLSQYIEHGSLSFPKTLKELQLLSGQLQLLKEQHYYHILLLFSAAYLYKQTFAIPGSVFMNILAGALFGLGWGLPLVCVLSACGASCCYVLSWAFGKQLVKTYLSHRIAPLEEKLNDDQHSLLFVLISFRLIPMTPNWLLNILSPLVGVPIHLFFISVLIGLIPYNFLSLQAGLVISELQTLSILNLKSVIILLLATASLLGTAVLRRFIKNRNVTTTKQKTE